MNKYKKWTERFITIGCVLVVFYQLMPYGILHASLGVSVLYIIWIVTKCLTSNDFLRD